MAKFSLRNKATQDWNERVFLLLSFHLFILYLYIYYSHL